MPLIARRRCCASSPWMVCLIILWVLFIFAFPLFLFKFVFQFQSPYFYIAYASVLLLVTYVAFSEKVQAEPTRAEQSPPTSAARLTVDVDMPSFNYRRFKDEVEDRSGEQCVICLCNYEEAEEPALSLPVCRHSFHVECVKRWLQSHGRCPICSASPFPTHAAPFPPPAPTDVVRVSVAIDAASTREYGNLTP